MAEFQEDKLELFLGAVRKYMQVRGPLSQKELAEVTEVGVSTMSRFLNKKTSELNPQLIAKIVAKLNIPLHEIIDFVDEGYADRFIRLVKFYRDDHEQQGGEDIPQAGAPEELAPAASEGSLEDALEENLSFGQSSTAQREVRGHIRVGQRTTPISYQSSGEHKSNKELTLNEKIQGLSPRQKAYLHDFLSLDMEGRDLIVDLGNNLFRYFKQKGMDL